MAGVGPASSTMAVTTNEQAVGPRQDPTNSPPKFPDNDGTTGADPITVTISEHAAPGSTVLNHTVVDADSDLLTYSVTGTDAPEFDEAFSQNTSIGAITVKHGTNLDYETKPSYSIIVNVTDSKTSAGETETGNPTIDDSVSVTINVEDVDETGTVTFTPAQPDLGIPITASVTDTDGAVTEATWQWSKADTATGAFTDITSATSATYRPAEADLGKFLKASVAYTDPLDSGKSASAVTGAAVQVVDRILVSNISTASSILAEGPTGLSQGFKTGEHPNGYKLSSMTVTATTNPQNMDVKVYTSTLNSGNELPNNEKYTLTYRSSSGRHRTYDAPTGTRLDPDTHYHITMQNRSSGKVGCLSLDANNENDTSAQDWDIHDTIRKVTADNEATERLFPNASCKIRLRGEAAKDGPHITDLSYSTEPTQTRTYDTGDIIKVAATFSEAVGVSSTDPPTLPLKIGSNTRTASYVSGDSSTTKLVFSYVVVAADRDDDGITIEAKLPHGRNHTPELHRGGGPGP